jgi:hypothetical protein
LAGIGGLGGIGAIGGLGGAAAIGGGLAGGAAGLAGLGGGLGGIGGFQGFGYNGALGQFGNLGGQFGFQGGNQSGQLILLIREVIGTPDDWVPLGGINRGLLGRLPGGGLPVEEDKDKDKENYGNSLGFYSPAMALVVKGTSRIHMNLGSGVFGVKKPEAAADLGFQREGALVIRPKKDRQKDKDDGGVQVANDAKDREKAKRKKAELDAKKIWDDALARGVNDPRLIIAVADFLAEINEMEHAGEFLKANLRQGIVARPWVFEALALALEGNGASPDELKRARLSVVDLEPQDAQSLLRAAKVMAEYKEWDRAITFCRQAAQLEPNVPHAYEAALAYAVKDRNVPAMEWAAGNIAKQDWPIDNLKLQDAAQAKLEALATALKESKRQEEAGRMVKSVDRLRERDLVIQLTWGVGESGPADLDLEVKEPNGSVCSCLQRMTAGGGTLMGDTLSEMNRETYVCAKGFSGPYEVTVRRIWGKPLGSRAKLVIIQHQGTPDEIREEQVIRFNRTHTVTVKLANGRRTSVAVVPPPGAYRRPETKDPGISGDNVMVKLRDLASPEFDGSSSGMSGRIGGFCGRPIARPGKVPLQRNQPEELAYQTAVSPFVPNDIGLTAQAVVSADRRYVRLSVNPVFNTVTNLGPGVLVNIPLIPGGFIP